ncbi:MAG: SecDF P1 head subdomain-containing protein, partial [Mycobacteriales bacterium]
EIQSLLQKRVDASRISGATVSLHGDTIQVSAPASFATQLRQLASVPTLRFRRVLDVGSFHPRAPSKAAPKHGESPSLAVAERDFARWDCARHPNPTGGNDVASDYVVACDPAEPASSASLKYLLAPAGVDGTDVREVTAGLGPTGGQDWVVSLMFTGHGTSAWLALTKQAYNATRSLKSGFGHCHPPKGCNAVAIVIGGVVISAPDIVQAGGIPGGQAQISGNFSEQTATKLAAEIKLGSLPIHLRLESFRVE